MGTQIAECRPATVEGVEDAWIEPLGIYADNDVAGWSLNYVSSLARLSSRCNS